MQLQVRDRLVGFLADTATHNEQVGREQLLDVGHVPRYPLGPSPVRHLLPVADGCRGSRLSIVPVEFKVAELGVWYQLAVDEQRAADTGAEGQQDDDSCDIAGRAEA